MLHIFLLYIIIIYYYYYKEEEEAEQRATHVRHPPTAPTKPNETCSTQRQRSGHQTNKTVPTTYPHAAISNVIAATAAIFVVIAAIAIGRQVIITIAWRLFIRVRFPLIVNV